MDRTTDTQPDSGEQVALARTHPSRMPSWLEQVSSVGADRVDAMFALNCQASSGIAADSMLVPDDVVDAVREWARHSAVVAADDMFHVGRATDEAPVVALADLGDLLGVPLGLLPTAYDDFRFATAVHPIVGRTIYLAMEDLAVRTHAIHDDEMARLRNGSIVPFVDEDLRTEWRHGCILACVPGRLASMGGPRGFRRALLDGGRALQWFADAAPDWTWTTEFDDHELCRIGDFDGIERFPLAIGFAPVDATQPPDSSSQPRQMASA